MSHKRKNDRQITEEQLDQPSDPTLDQGVVQETNIATDSDIIPSSQLTTNLKLDDENDAEEKDTESTRIAKQSQKSDSATQSIVSNEEVADQAGSNVKLWRQPIFWLTIGLIGLLIGLLINRVLTHNHLTIGRQLYTDQSTDQIVQQTIALAKDQMIGFQLAGQAVVKLKMGNAGIAVDAQDLSRQIDQSRQFNLSNLLTKPPIKAKFIVDYPVLQSVLDQQFPHKLVRPVDASVVYNRDQNQFVVKPASDGFRVEARRALTNASQLALDQQTTFPVQYQPVAPLVSTAEAQHVEQYLNQRLRLRLNLNHNGKLLYFADPWDIADWVEMKTDTATNKIIIDFSKQKIQGFIEKTVSPEIARGVVNKKVLVNDQGQVLQILQHGQRGLGAINPGNSAEKIRQALLDNQNLEHDLDIREIDFIEERIPISGLKWIEVNLTRQTTTLYSGDRALQTFMISSGVHPWPTPTGTYKVWFKNPIQRMRGGTREAGDYYDLPNVRWNTYFNRDIGFHTAYWHNNFGRPMSHGCINMREADAKVVFDFAPIGTMVVVRY